MAAAPPRNCRVERHSAGHGEQDDGEPERDAVAVPARGRVRGHGASEVAGSTPGWAAGPGDEQGAPVLTSAASTATEAHPDRTRAGQHARRARVPGHQAKRRVPGRRAIRWRIEAGPPRAITGNRLRAPREHLEDTTDDDRAVNVPMLWSQSPRPGSRSTRAKECQRRHDHPTPPASTRRGTRPAALALSRPPWVPIVQAIPTRYAAIPATASRWTDKRARLAVTRCQDERRQRPPRVALSSGRQPGTHAASWATGSPAFPHDGQPDPAHQVHRHMGQAAAGCARWSLRPVCEGHSQGDPRDQQDPRRQRPAP